MMFSNVGEKVVEKTVPTGDETTPSLMAHQIHEFIQSLDFVPDAVGICVPGLVKDGVLFYASDRRNLEGLSEDMISTPQYRAYMINDIRAAMYSQIPIYPKCDRHWNWNWNVCCAQWSLSLRCKRIRGRVGILPSSIRGWNSDNL